MEDYSTAVLHNVHEFASGITFGAGGFRSNELERVQDSIPWVKEVFQNPVRL